MKFVTTSKFLSDFDAFVEMVRIGPVAIKEEGHPTLIAVSAEEYARLKLRDRDPAIDQNADLTRT
jgi:PHD/YefM family antitoxin component YafN of YafNO toxin-antitoxin module